uniref:Uncharacterized protein n=1 Tax=Romanomermis culicivorax TaxID=13658 RepID=A0A915KNR7_ROMCU
MENTENFSALSAGFQANYDSLLVLFLLQVRKDGNETIILKDAWLESRSNCASQNLVSQVRWTIWCSTLNLYIAQWIASLRHSGESSLSPKEPSNSETIMSAFSWSAGRKSFMYECTISTPFPFHSYLYLEETS